VKGVHGWVAGVAAVLALSLPTAVATAAKQTCRKAVWKCAPRRYHLEASGILAPHGGAYGQEVWSAELDLSRRRASVGEVDYAQTSGTATLSLSSTYDDCWGDPGTLNATEQTVAVPPEDLNRSDFSLFFDLLGKDKGSYFLTLGAVQEELSNIMGTGTINCPNGIIGMDGATTAQRPVWLINSGYIPSEGRARPGKSPISGSGWARATGSAKWKLTRR
jgi:hypothetical protein